MNRLLRNLTLGVVCSGLGLWLACDSATPTAPSGTILTITANPSQIGLTGSSQITVIGRRPDGNPLNPGTEIFFSTNIGSISPTIVAVDGEGVARATFQGDGRVGTANVTASLSVTSGGGGGDGEEGDGGSSTGVGSATIEVLVGRAAGNISLQATPTSISEDFGAGNQTRQISLLALVRDDQGQPLADASVNFSTEVGALNSGGAFTSTNNQGEARDTLQLTEGDINSVAGDTFQVTAETASGSAELQSDVVMISILRLPEANFESTQNPTNRTVIFQDTSTGNPTKWEWDFDFQNNNFTVDSTLQNPTFTYTSDGDYTVALRVTNTAGTDQISKIVTVNTD